MEESHLYDSPSHQREKFFTALYKRVFPPVAKHVSKMGGSFDDAKDIFQDTLVIYYEKKVNGLIEIKVNEQAYLLGIAKHLWAVKFRKTIKDITLDNNVCEDQPMEEQASQPSRARVIRYLEKAGQKCMEILQAFYYDKLPADQIAEMFGYSGVRSATVQKYKCMEKVRETIKERSLGYADFIE